MINSMKTDITVRNKRQTQILNTHYQLNREDLYASIGMWLQFINLIWLWQATIQIQIIIKYLVLVYTKTLLFSIRRTILTKQYAAQTETFIVKQSIYNTIVQSVNQTFFKILVVLLLLLGLCVYKFIYIERGICCWHTCMQYTQWHPPLTHIHIYIKWTSTDITAHKYTHAIRHSLLCRV